jgi:HlyD family secretion protein
MFFKKLKIKSTAATMVILSPVLFILTSCMRMPFVGASGEMTDQGIETFEVNRGDIYQTFSTTGSVESQLLNTYNMQISGKILNALEEGDYFKKGDMLVEIDNSDGLSQIEQIEKNLKLSEISLKTARTNYQAALDSNHIAIQMAELNTEKAEESTESTLKSIEIANENSSLSYKSAERALEEAEEILELARNNPKTTNEQLAQYKSNVKSAEEKLESAEISADSSKSQSESSYNQSLINQSTTYWSNLSSLQSAARQIESAKNNIEQSEIQLELASMEYESAKESLEDYILYAPYDGMVYSTDFKAGNQNSGNSAISIINNNFLIRTTISESEVSKISEDSEVYITMDAYPDYGFSGEVKKLIPVAVENGNIVSFEVIINLTDTGDNKIYYGFSADVDIVTAKVENVLYVPIRAVYVENGKKYVDVMVSGQVNPDSIENSIKKTEITTGINDYQYIEVVSGLKEGDVIITSRI